VASRRACEYARQSLDEFAPITIEWERYTERAPHPGGQEAFTIRAQFPWQRSPLTRVIIETSLDEQLLKPVAKRRILHEYGEPIRAQISVYALEEIVAEKLRHSSAY